MAWIFSAAMVEACESWPCSPGPAAESSLATSAGTAPCAPSSGTPTPQAFSSDSKTLATYRRSRYGITCAPLTDDRGEALLTAFLAGSRAKTSASPAVAPGSTASGPGCGASSPGWFAKWSPNGSEWRTAQRSLLGDSELFSATWPRSGLMRAGMCFQRPTLAPGICVSASGSLLPTLTVSGNNNAPKEGTKRGYGLATAVRLLPTLIATEGKRSANSRTAGSSPGRAASLTAQVNLLPTLAARDFRFPNAKSFEERGGGKRGEQLPNSVGGPLNPDWCEWFMGFPIGWTASNALEMPKFPEWLQQHGFCWPRT